MIRTGDKPAGKDDRESSRRVLIWVGVGLACTFLWNLFGPYLRSSRQVRPPEAAGKLVAVQGRCLEALDGLTFTAELGGRRDTLRLISLRLTDYDEYLTDVGSKAKICLAAKTQGKAFHGWVTERRDFFGRMTGYFYFGDQFINGEMLKTGLASLADRPSPDLHYQKMLKIANEPNLANFRRRFFKFVAQSRALSDKMLSSNGFEDVPGDYSMSYFTNDLVLAGLRRVTDQAQKKAKDQKYSEAADSIERYLSNIPHQDRALECAKYLLKSKIFLDAREYDQVEAFLEEGVRLMKNYPGPTGQYLENALLTEAYVCALKGQHERGWFFLQQARTERGRKEEYMSIARAQRFEKLTQILQGCRFAEQRANEGERDYLIRKIQESVNSMSKQDADAWRKYLRMGDGVELST